MPKPSNDQRRMPDRHPHRATLIRHAHGVLPTMQRQFRTAGDMTAAQARTISVAIGCLCMAYGVIYTFTPGGFSWSLVLLGAILTLPWFLRRRTPNQPVAQVAVGRTVPPWHPEFEE